MKKQAKGLTPRQEAFAQHFALHDNQVEAYIHSFKPKSTNRRSIGVMASKMVAETPKILERVNELRLEAARLAKESFGVDAQWVLGRLIEELNADVADLFEERDNRLRLVRDWPEVWRRGLVSGLDIETRVTEDGETISVSKVRLSERARRLEMLGKHVDVKAFADKREGQVPDAATLPISATDGLIEIIIRKGKGGASS